MKFHNIHSHKFLKIYMEKLKVLRYYTCLLHEGGNKTFIPKALRISNSLTDVYWPDTHLVLRVGSEDEGRGFMKVVRRDEVLKSFLRKSRRSRLCFEILVVTQVTSFLDSNFVGSRI